MGSKHTPGPWKASTTKHRDGLGAATHYATIYQAGNAADGVVCNLAERGYDEPSDAFSGNVRLIASAPDLLAALGAIEAEAFSGEGGPVEALDACTRIIALARAAIAKAEGRCP